MSNKYFQTPFASDGDKAEIADLPQPDGTVSYQAGYGADYETNPAANGGKFMFIERSQMNGLLNEITGNLKAWQEQGYYTYNPAIKYGIGGRCIYSDGSVMKAYVSTVANNTRVPSINGTVQPGWELGDVFTAMEQFGLFGKSKSLTDFFPTGEICDLNHWIIAGTYYCDIHLAPKALNSPFNSSFHLVVFSLRSMNSASDTSGYLRTVQIAFLQSLNSNPIKIRIGFKDDNNPIRWGNWQSFGNKGINLSATPVTISWETNYNAPTNGTLWVFAQSTAVNQYIILRINGIKVVEKYANGTVSQPTFTFPVRAGQTINVYGTVPGTSSYPRQILFYPD